MCHVPFPGQWVKGQGQISHMNFCSPGRGILVDRRCTISCCI